MFAGQHDSVRPDAAFRVARPAGPGAARRGVPVAGARPLLRRLRGRRAPARRARGAAGGGRADPARPRLLAPAEDLQARRVPPGLRREVPRVQRGLAGGHRLHGRALRGAASLDRPAARERRVRDVLHADAARADRDAARRVPGAARRALRPSRDAAARAGGRGGQPVGAGVPDHLRGGEAGRGGGASRHARRGGLRRLAAARAGRAGASRLPPRAARGPAGGRPDRRRARPPRRRGEPVPRPRGEQQEALRAARRPALRPPGGGRGAACDRRDDPVDARAARRAAPRTGTGSWTWSRSCPTTASGSC